MNQLSWNSEGIGFVTLALTILFLILFKRKTFGLFDPLSMFIVFRVAPTFGALFVLVSSEALLSYFFLLAFISVCIFVAALFYSTPKIKISHPPITRGDLRLILRVAIFLCVVKSLILFSSVGALPIFGDRGSDSFIDFASDNKIGTSFLFAIGSAELVLLSFIVPFEKGWKRIIVFTLILMSIFIHLASGKKASLLSIFLAVALGDYLRSAYSLKKNSIFLGGVTPYVFILSSFVWAGWILSETADLQINESLLDLVIKLPDLIYFQWAYPTILFASGELSDFFQSYQVNRFIYFFHSVFSPLGLPAFSASIGPALNEYQTGNLTGNGINPTYLLEGYVIFGFLLPVYALLVGLVVGKIRNLIDSVQKSRNAVILYSFLLTPIYILPADALLFMKIVFALVILVPVVVLSSRRLLWLKKNQ